MGKVVEKFGQVIQDECDKKPEAARKLLLAGYRAKRLQIKAAPGKQMNKAVQKAALETFDSMIDPLAHPDKAAMVSLFTPCEMLQVAGLHPYSCEGFGCFLSGTRVIERLSTLPSKPFKSSTRPLARISSAEYACP